MSNLSEGIQAKKPNKKAKTVIFWLTFAKALRSHKIIPSSSNKSVYLFSYTFEIIANISQMTKVMAKEVKSWTGLKSIQ